LPFAANIAAVIVVIAGTPEQQSGKGEREKEFIGANIKQFHTN